MDLKSLAKEAPWDWPKDAGEYLRGILRNDQITGADGILAAELASSFAVADDEMADALLAVVANGRRPVAQRTRAAMGLGPMLESRSLADLGELGDDADASDSSGPPISQGAFNELQGSLRQLFEDPGFDEEILESLDSNDIEVQRNAVEAAGTWELPGAWDHVCALIEDENTDKDLLLSAIAAVGNIRPGSAEAVLSPLLDSEDEEVIEAVEETLMMVDAMDDDYDEDEFEDDDEYDADDHDEHDDDSTKRKH